MYFETISKLIETTIHVNIINLEGAYNIIRN